MWTLSRSSKRNSAGVDPGLLAVRDLALQISPVDFGHPEHAGLRTAEVQMGLFRAGASKADGTTNRSRHQDGKALDFFAFVNGRPSWHHPHLAMVAAAFMQAGTIIGYPLSWGGLWVPDVPQVIDGIPYGWDCGHIEGLER